jgi:hypothetical protein
VQSPPRRNRSREGRRPRRLLRMARCDTKV